MFPISYSILDVFYLVYNFSEKGVKDVSDIATMVTDKGKISVVLYRYIHIHDT
jgi:hypothetical protein